MLGLTTKRQALQIGLACAELAVPIAKYEQDMQKANRRSPLGHDQVRQMFNRELSASLTRPHLFSDEDLALISFILSQTFNPWLFHQNRKIEVYQSDYTLYAKFVHSANIQYRTSP